MSITDIEEELTARVRNVCNAQARYRVLWIVGEPRCGKSSLCKSLCKNNGWKYINYTLSNGFLDSLVGQEEIYRPHNFLEDLHHWCNQSTEDFIVFDEIEPLLSLWTWDTQEEFFKLVGRATGLTNGIVITTRARTAQQLSKIFSGMDPNHIYEIQQGVISWCK
jgi:ATPase family associated with various cellular activities (AAA)